MLPQTPKQPPISLGIMNSSIFQPTDVSPHSQLKARLRRSSTWVLQSQQHHGQQHEDMEGEHDEGQQHEDEEAGMEGESDEVEQNEGQHHEVEQVEMGKSDEAEVIWLNEKLAYMERRVSPSGALSSGAASSGPRPEDKFRVTVDLEQAIADEWLEQAIAAENSAKEEVMSEKDELEMDSDDYEAYTAESVVPEHFQCLEGDKPVLVYDLSSVPNKQLVAELARRLGD